MKIAQYIGIGLLLIALGGTSCNQLLDINEDPLAAKQDDIDANPEVLFVDIMVSLSSDRVLETNVFNRWAQYYVGASFGDADNYSVPDYPQNNTWATMYRKMIKNAVLGRRAAEKSDRPNVAAQFLIMEAVAYYHLTLMFEDVPLDEVMDFDGEQLFTRYPNYNSQEEVLIGVVNKLTDAINSMQLGDDDRIVDQDLIYQGDLALWQLFANSLRIKTLMILSGKGAEYHEALQIVFDQPYITLLSQEAIFRYGNSIANANQLYKLHQQFADGQSQFFFASEPFVETLNSRLDPRIEVFFDRGQFNSSSAPHIGMEPGSGAAFVVTSVLSLNFITPTTPDIWQSAAELRFLKAEAITRGWIEGTAAEAQELYYTGVIQHCYHLNNFPGVIEKGATLSDFEIGTYLEDQVPDISLMDAERALQEIHFQQYIEAFGRGLDAWTFVRRTGFPDRPLPVNTALGGHLTRLPYAADEVSANTNIPDQPALDKLMWFMSSEQ
ncbi:SusD/RagB family nutrient-binding outer membrane lipoprotein [Algivirga pacifica]|uniref:SusD/RagB family nutrient-binding outer membrane lipoprotein n=1 Tax=Algivirga pacifica TaxID=1162670 RepID=A0ABP9DHY4_9BACT